MSELFIRHSSKMSTQGTPLIRVPCTTQACGYEWAEQYLLTIYIIRLTSVSSRNVSGTHPPESRIPQKCGESHTLLRERETINSNASVINRVLRETPIKYFIVFMPFRNHVSVSVSYIVCIYVI